MHTVSTEIRTRQLGSWTVNECLGMPIVFGDELVAEALAWIERWVGVFPKEPTYAWICYGVPSLIVRLDCTVMPQGRLFIYEIEDRPSGVGQTGQLNLDFHERLVRLMASWPPLALVAPSSRRENDDAFWPNTRRLSIDEAYETNDYLILREDPADGIPVALADRSVSTACFEGSKRYGVDLGWWRSVDDYQVASLIESGVQSFVLKPTEGMHYVDGERTRKGLVIYHAGPQSRRPPGTSSARQVRRRFEHYDSMYLQRYVAPRTLLVDPDVDHWLRGKTLHWIYRVYFGFNPERQSRIPLGGFWEARKEVIVNGASNSVSGPAPLG